MTTEFKQYYASINSSTKLQSFVPHLIDKFEEVFIIA